AEDGIRDFHVTGVQTCALPICARVRGLRQAGLEREHGRGLRLGVFLGDAGVLQLLADVRDVGIADLRVLPVLAVLEVVRTLRQRSEERRVGKGRQALAPRAEYN